MLSPPYDLLNDESSLPTLDELWRPGAVAVWLQVTDGHGHILGLTPYGVGDTKIRVAGDFIPITHFADVHPEFPGAIHKMYEQYDRPIGHYKLISTKWFLTSAWRVFPPSAFSDTVWRDEDHYAISLLRSSLTEKGELRLRYYHAVVVGDVETGRYASRTAVSSGVVRKEWLDENYPGWLERYKIGDSVGMEKMALAYMVLPSAGDVTREATPLPEVLATNLP